MYVEYAEHYSTDTYKALYDDGVSCFAEKWGGRVHEVQHYPLPQILHCPNKAVAGGCLLIVGAVAIVFNIQKRQSQKTGKAQVSNNYVVGNASTTNVLAAIRRAGIPS